MSCSSAGDHPWVTLGLPEKGGEAGERYLVIMIFGAFWDFLL